MPTFPPDLYPHLVSTLFQGPVPMGSSTDLSHRYAYSVTREEWRQCRRPTRTCIGRLAATCRAMRRAVLDAHTQDAHAAVLRWWRNVLDTPLIVGRTPQDDVPEGDRRIFIEGGEMHRLWLPAPLGDSNDVNRYFEPGHNLYKTFVVWIHRHRSVLKLQCGLQEHSGPSITFQITDREHPSDDEAMSNDAQEDEDDDADDEVSDADADSSDAASVATSDSDDVVSRPNVQVFLQVIHACEIGIEAGEGIDAVLDNAADADQHSALDIKNDDKITTAEGKETGDGEEVDHGWPPVPDDAAKSASAHSSSGESWTDIDLTDHASFVPVPEDELQARVRQWLREQRAAFFPFACVREDEC